LTAGRSKRTALLEKKQFHNSAVTRNCDHWVAMVVRQFTMSLYICWFPVAQDSIIGLRFLIVFWILKCLKSVYAGNDHDRPVKNSFNG